jgi:hypothetical protein
LVIKGLIQCRATVNDKGKVPLSASAVHVSRYFYRISMEVVIIKIAKRFDKYASAPETTCLG